MAKAKHGKHAKTTNKQSAEKIEQTEEAGASTIESGASSETAADDALTEGADNAVLGKHAAGAHAPKTANLDDVDSSSEEFASDDDAADEDAVPEATAFIDEGTVDGSGAYESGDIMAQATMAAPYAAVPAVAPGVSPTPHLSDLKSLSAQTMVMPAVPGATGDGTAAPLIVDGVELVKKRKNTKKIAAIVGGSIAGALVLVYLAGTAIFSNWFFPGTKIGAIDASMKTTQEVAAALDGAVSNYQVQVTGLNFSASVDASNAGVKIDSEHIAQQMHYALPSWQWPLLIAQTEHDLTGLFSTDYSANEALNKELQEKVERFNETAQLPVNANISYDQEKKQFVVVPEVKGTAINPAAVISRVTDAILSLETTVELTEEDLIQPAFKSTDEILANAAVTASNLVNVDIPLVMGGNAAGEINSDVVAQWVKLQGDGSVALDNAAMDAYISQLAAGLNTVGSQRTYTRPDGKVITVEGGVYGWEIDNEALRTSITNAVMSGASQTIEVATISQGETFTAPGEKDWGNRYIDIDLSEQHVRMYDENGYLIWESDCISGAPDGEHDTNTGVYWLNSKASPSKLIGYDRFGNKIYESNVRYWMPFVGNAIGLHDADWQPGFGGYMYANGYGSHGCVNLPVSAAYELYQITMEGDCVVSHW